MKILLIFFFATPVCVAQTYQESMLDCIAKNRVDVSSKAFAEEMAIRRIRFRECVIGLRFTDFVATTVYHEKISLESLEGKVVLINTWYISCSPCVAEIPVFNELCKEFGEDFVVLSFGTDDASSIYDFIENRPMNYKVFADSKETINHTFMLQEGFPTNVLLNKKGEIFELKTGGPVDETGLKRIREEYRWLIRKELAK